MKTAVQSSKRAVLQQPRFAMARGVLVLDENLFFLKDELENKRFKVRFVKEGQTDEEIISDLTHRILVTNNPKDFLRAAPIEEFSIIDTTNAVKDAKVLATQISNAFTDLELKSKQPFLLQLKKSGKPVLRLID
jgi:hypothetical protein